MRNGIAFDPADSTTMSARSDHRRRRRTLQCRHPTTSAASFIIDIVDVAPARAFGLLVIKLRTDER
jgi:hypothetical protein